MINIAVRDKWCVAEAKIVFAVCHAKKTTVTECNQLAWKQQINMSPCFLTVRPLLGTFYRGQVRSLLGQMLILSTRKAPTKYVILQLQSEFELSETNPAVSLVSANL